MSSARETEPARIPEDAKGDGTAAPRGSGPEAERLLAVSLDLLLIADFDYRIRRVEVTEGALAQGDHLSRPAAAEDVPALLGHVLGG